MALLQCQLIYIELVTAGVRGKDVNVLWQLTSLRLKSWLVLDSSRLVA
jgi:hypothetical protein